MEPTPATALLHRAMQARQAGRADEGIAIQRKAIAILREAGDAAACAHAVRHLADMLSDAGDAAAAAPLFAEALAFYAAQGAPLDAANAIRGAALNAQRLGDREAALPLWEEARRRYSDLAPLFSERIGPGENPGTSEADAHLAELRKG